MIAALVGYYGCKRSIVRHIIRQLGRHKRYYEPFCGSMAVLLGKKPCKTELVNDLNGDIINLAEVVRDPVLGPRLYRMLRRNVASEALYNYSASVFHSNPKCETRPDLNRAYDYFITSWLGMNGVAGTWPPRISFCARFQGDGGDPAVRFQSVISSIPQWRRRMRSTFVLCRDGFKIIPRVGDQSASAMYVDPPYLDKSARYIHDFTSDDPDSNDPLVRKHGQHGLLARQLHRFEKTRVVLSYYDHPALAELYPSWSIIRLKAGGMSNAQVGRTPGNAKSKKQEVLLMNGPVLGGGLFDESLPGEPLQP